MSIISEKLSGIVQRVTYHNPENGWSVLKVQPHNRPGDPVTVTVHQTKVFAGATVEFHGSWVTHPHFGNQFKATHALEKKPASIGALQKYLGSGLIKGVGPKTAQKIVGHFGEQTLNVFEENIDSLTKVPGIASKKLEMIKEAWQEHRKRPGQADSDPQIFDPGVKRVAVLHGPGPQHIFRKRVARTRILRRFVALDPV